MSPGLWSLKLVIVVDATKLPIDGPRLAHHVAQGIETYAMSRSRHDVSLLVRSVKCAYADDPTIERTAWEAFDRRRFTEWLARQRAPP